MNRLTYFPAIQVRRLHISAACAIKSKRPIQPWVNDGWWLEDHKPRRTPETAEQRKASAAKYGLREQDYKPLDPELGWGEYPDLANVNYDVKDPYENWSNTRHRRNFGEPVHYLFHLRTAEKFVTTDTESMTPLRAGWTALKTLAAILAVGGFALYGGRLAGPDLAKPAKSKEYPYDFERAYPYSDAKKFPLTHYTFEPADAPDKLHHH